MGISERGIEERNRKITLQLRTDTQDSFGEPVAAWSTVASVWAKITPSEGREYLTSGSEQDATPFRFEFLYGSEWSALNVRDHRISWDSKTFDLVSVNNVEQRNREFDCVAVYHG